MKYENLQFLAMEYYGLILNRTYEVTVTDSEICGAVVCEIMSAVGANVLKAMQSGNAYDLVSDRNVQAVRKHPVGSAEFLSLSKANFSINIRDITSITYNPSKKWGMGKVPHNGKIYIEFGSQKKKELILLGMVNVQEIISSLSSRGFPVVIT